MTRMTRTSCPDQTTGVAELSVTPNDFMEVKTMVSIHDLADMFIVAGMVGFGGVILGGLLGKLVEEIVETIRYSKEEKKKKVDATIL